MMSLGLAALSVFYYFNKLLLGYVCMSLQMRNLELLSDYTLWDGTWDSARAPISLPITQVMMAKVKTAEAGPPKN
jgi:hypothetical protein